MVGNDGLSNGGTDGIDLGRHTAALHADSDVKVGELILSEDKDGLEGLESEGLGLDELNGLAIDLDEATALLGKSASSGRLFPEVKEEKEDTRKHQELDKIDTTRILATEPIVARRLLPLLRPPTPMQQPIPAWVPTEDMGT